MAVAVPLTATYATAGTFTWICPAGITSVTVACVAAGGGGGAAAAATGSQGGGGGGGEASLEATVGVTPGLGYVVTTGAGGLGGSAGGNGAAGGNSSFAGDTLTVVANGGQFGTAGTATGAGQLGIGGDGSVNSVSVQGGNGDAGTPAVNGGGGGGASGVSGGVAFPGGNAAGSVAGAGGGGTFPGGAGGAGATTGAPGSNGAAPGGGGGGALSTGTATSGGNGTDGSVIITWSMTDPLTLTGNTAGGVVTYQAPWGATLVTAQAWGAGAGGFDVQPGSGGTFNPGATVGKNNYPGFTEANAITNFDGFVKRAIATKACKIYQQPDGVYGPVTQDWKDEINAGCRLLINLHWNRTAIGAGGSQATAEINNIVAFLNEFVALGANFDISLWAEANDKTTPFGNSQGPLFKQHFQTIAPTLKTTFGPSGSNVVWNAASAGQINGTGLWADYYPGDAYVDMVLLDYYASAFLPGVPGGGLALDGIAAIADNHAPNPIPFGLGEWNTGQATTITVAQWNSYWQYIRSFFLARKNAGKTNGPIIFFMGNTDVGNTTAQILSASDFKIPGLQSVFDTFAGSPTGGAGGGGGEYAAEATLAVTSLSSYALAVGDGGADGFSGTASTIAGSSVTVTANPGLVASSVGTGGLGGSGSGNTTHHPGGAGGAGAANGGGGGGGASGGTAATGGAGGAGTATAAGAAGAAVAGGGPGGKGGTPSTNGAQPLSGPGGGGGARGATALLNGAGLDGQVTLSGFVIHPDARGGLGLAGVGFNATGVVTTGAASYALGALAGSGTATVTKFTFVQNSSTFSSAGAATTATLTAASTAGTLLVANVLSNGTVQTGAGPGWLLAKAEPAGAGSGRIEQWYYPSNPGGITAVTFTGATGDLLRVNLSEFSGPAGYTQAVDGTPGVAQGVGATSLPVSTPGTNLGGGLAVVSFEAQYSTAGAAWTTPAGWSHLNGQGSVPNQYEWYYLNGTTQAAQSVSGILSTATNQTGWSAVLVVYTTVSNTPGPATLALAGLGFAGTGNAVVSGGNVTTSGGLALGALAVQSPSLAVTFPQNPLPVKVEILVNGSWADITGYVYTRDNIIITNRGRPDEASTAQPAQVTITLDNRDQSFSPQNPASQFYPFLLRNTQLRISVVNAVTPQGAWYNGYRWWGEVPAWPPQWNPAGTDVYVQITAAGVLQRMRQSKFSASPLARYYANQVTNSLASGQANNPASLIPAGYWPCEDGSNSTSFSSGIPGGSPMTFSGTPGLAADSNVAGSAPFATLTSSAWTGIPGAFSTGGFTFTTPGMTTWLCPAGVTTVKAECWGGGGGGGNGGGPAGAGAEYAAEGTLAVTPGLVYQVIVAAGGAGAPGSFSKQRGSAGGTTTFKGDNVTVTANGGGGAPLTGHATGGSGSRNTTRHNGGNGGSDGGGFGGPGGGGSGAAGAGGNTGSQSSGTVPGTGANAVPGGGPGGAGGNGATAAQGLVASPGMIASPGPGGGGGAGGFQAGNDYYKPGGAGQSGQVAISFGTQAPAPPANVLRFVLDVPFGGGVDGAYMCQALTTGTVADFHVKWHTGGNLEFKGNNSAASQLFTSGSKAFGAIGTNSTTPNPLLVSAELTQTKPTQITWKLTAIKPGATAVVATFTGTITGTLGTVTFVKTNSTAPIDTGSTGVGHISIQYAVDPILNLSGAFAAYAGELAGARVIRLCAEQRVPMALTGNTTDTPQMGPQPAGLLVDLLQDCENADLGQLFERRDVFGLGYRTRMSLQGQAPTVILNLTGGQLAQGLTPTNDDQLTRNDIIATRTHGGTTYEAVLSTGTMSVQDPPNGVGLYSYQVTPNLFADSQLANFAGWILTLGTLDEFRYPVITIDLRRVQVSDGTFYGVAALDVGSFLQIINPPAWLPQVAINQLAFGFTETIGWNEWTIAINAVPEDPYGGAPPLPTW